MAFLIKPERQELVERKKLHENARTMSFLGHTEPFPEELWDAFLQEEVNTDPAQKLYRLIFCDGCMEFTAETSWQYDKDMNDYLLSILVRADMRREGYGEEALRLMKLEAGKYDIHSFSVRVSEDNVTAAAFLRHEGFKEVQPGIYRLVF